RGVRTGAKEADQEAWTLTAPSTTTATHATSSTDDDTNRTRRSNADATTTASASASSMINSAVMIDTTDVLHHDPLLHTRARNRSTPTASVLSPFGCDKLTSR